jgi:hypothetical protein
MKDFPQDKSGEPIVLLLAFNEAGVTNSLIHRSMFM